MHAHRTILLILLLAFGLSANEQKGSIAARTNGSVGAYGRPVPITSARGGGRRHEQVEYTGNSDVSSSGSQAAGVIHIPLERFVNPSRYKEVMLGLKMRQERSLSLVEQSEVPLEQEILTEKHIATYFGRLTIGKTTFKVLFDTGSCEFWVPSSQCTTSRCHKHTQYPISTEEPLQLASTTPMNIQYLSGKVVGSMVYETVQLGEVPVPKQVVGLASIVDIELLDDVVWDGILGLAYPNPQLTAKGIVPLFDNVVHHRLLTDRGLANQFAYYIDDTQGSVTLGGANCDLITPEGSSTSECVNQFKFVPVSEKTYWTIELSDVRVKYPNQPEISGFCKNGPCKAIVDTGTYLIYGPQNQVNHMLSTNLRTCGHHTTMPEVTFDFKVDPGDEPVTMTLKPIDYILKFEISGNEDCVVGISPDKDTIWTLGQVFLRSFYTLFDRDDDRIGFARLPRENFNALNKKIRNKEVYISRAFGEGEGQGQAEQEQQSQEPLPDFDDIMLELRDRKNHAENQQPSYVPVLPQHNGWYEQQIAEEEGVVYEEERQQSPDARGSTNSTSEQVVYYVHDDTAL